MISQLTTEVKSNGLRNFRLRFSPEVRRINRDTANVIAERQRQLVPVLTGALRDSIRVEEKSSDEFEVIEGGGSIDYGIHVEYGTERQAAQPHQRPAAQEGLRYQRQQYRGLK